MRKCRNDPNRFCYICGKVILPGRQAKITQFVRKAYHAYFRMKLGDQDKAFAPHVCCKACVEGLRSWSVGKRESLPFGLPMAWREGKDHVTDCYFCMTNLQGMLTFILHGRIFYLFFVSFYLPSLLGPETAK